MSLLSLILPVINQPDSTEDPKVTNALTAIQTWANGNVDAQNLSNGAVTAAKLASQGLISGNGISAANLNAQYTIYQPTCGATGTGIFFLNVPGITFASTCLYALTGGALVYTDAGHTLLTGSANFSFYVIPNGNAVRFAFCNNTGSNLFPQVPIMGIGF